MVDIFAEKYLGTCFHVTVTHLDRHLILSRSHMNGISLTHISTLTCSSLKRSSFEGLQNAHDQITTEQLCEKREQRLKVYWTATDFRLFNAQTLSPFLPFCYSVSVDFCLKLCMCPLCNDRSCHVLIWRDLGWRLLKLLLLPICSSVYHPPPPMYTHWSLDCVVSQRWSGKIKWHKHTLHSYLLHAWHACGGFGKNIYIFFCCCFLRGQGVGSGFYATFGNLTFGYTVLN